MIPSSENLPGVVFYHLQFWQSKGFPRSSKSEYVSYAPELCLFITLAFGEAWVEDDVTYLCVVGGEV